MTIELLKGARVHSYYEPWPYRGKMTYETKVIENVLRRAGGGYTWTDPKTGREHWVTSDHQARVVEDT